MSESDGSTADRYVQHAPQAHGRIAIDQVQPKMHAIKATQIFDHLVIKNFRLAC